MARILAKPARHSAELHGGHNLITYFSKLTATTPTHTDTTTGDFVARLREHAKRDLDSKHEAELFSPTRFSGPRCNANAVEVNYLVVDLDGVSQAVAQDTVSALREGGLETIVYPTFSDSDEARCLRIVVPLSKPVPAHHWREFWNAAIEYLGLPKPPPRASGLKGNDKGAEDCSRAYYLPSGEVQVLHKHGSPLNVDAIEYYRAPKPESIVTDNLSVVLSDPDSPVKSFDLSEFDRKVRARAPQRPVLRRLVDCLDAKPPEALAPSGGRDNALTQVCAALSHVDYEVPPSAIAQYLRPVLNQWEDDESKSWPDKALDILTRFRRRDIEGVKRQNASKLQLQAAVVPKWRAEASPSIQQVNTGELPTYAAEEVADWASARGLTAEQLARQSVVQMGEEYYVFFGGQYGLNPIKASEAESFLWRELAPWHGFIGNFKVFTEKRDQTGETVTRTPVKRAALIEQFGSRASKVEYSYLQSHTTFEPETRTLTLGIPRRITEPEYNPEIEQWLRLMIPSDIRKDVDAWLHKLTDLSVPLPLLILQGEGNAGKGLFAMGCSQYLGAPYVNGRTIYSGSQFNSILKQSPLVYFDESLPGSYNFSQLLREEITMDERQISEKYRGEQRLKGYLRWLHSRNDLDGKLFSREHLSVQDLKAIGSRVLVVNVSYQAKDFLESNGGWSLTKQWVDEGKLGRHFAALAAGYGDGVRGQRFFVDGNLNKKYAVAQAVQNDWTGTLLQVCIRAYLDMPIAEAKDAFVYSDEGLFVSPGLLSEPDVWEKYGNGARPLSSVAIGKVLKSLGCKRYVLATNKAMKFRLIPNALCVEWGTQTDISNEASLADRWQVLSEGKPSPKLYPTNERSE